VPKPTAAANENSGDEKKVNETPAGAPSEGNETRREERTAVPKRPRLPDLAVSPTRRLPRADAPRGREATAASKRQKNLARPPRVEPARREETAQLAAEREAAEKVLYALRVTSEKLNYARRQVQESARGEANR
jgi:hypothetical protein